MTRSDLDYDVRRFLTEIHRVIDEISLAYARPLPGRANDASLAEPDEHARQILSDACRRLMFQVFSLMDGVADPELTPGGWSGLSFARRHEHDRMLHDEFMEAYEAYERLSGGEPIE